MIRRHPRDLNAAYDNGPPSDGYPLRVMGQPPSASQQRGPGCCGGYRHYGRAASYSPGRPWSLDGAALANKVH
jgi:hypothetical protein